MKSNAIDQIQQLRHDLTRRFPERQSVIDGSLAAIVAGEHVLFLGPPGTAKSALARALAQAFGAQYFERLLTKFSTPDEVFGPVSLKALEQDRFERVITNKLPEANFAFIDEVYKANSAILNSLLTLMNERIYHNADKVLKCPLITLFGASNELPDGKDLEAVSDRFTMKFEVQYVTQLKSLRTILSAPEDVPVAVFSLEDLADLQKFAATVEISDATVDGLIAIREACQAEGIIASDRRWKKCLKLVQASAALMGEVTTTPEDLALLADMLWREPNEREKIARIVAKHADPTYSKAMEVLEAAREIARKLVGMKADKDKSKYIGHAAQSIETFEEQKAELAKFTAQTTGKRALRAIQDAQAEIQGMIAESTRVAASALGLGGSTLRRAT